MAPVFIEDDDHRAAADFAVIVYFCGHFFRRWDYDFEGFETSGAGDEGSFHREKLREENVVFSGSAEHFAQPGFIDYGDAESIGLVPF